ncbi:MAG TPA: creatininase family protein [Acidimicrobiales bacterium]|jgi:creatinine amidohydrolase|nr:creatininase family protein [Acidimicrobiales bacterium]
MSLYFTDLTSPQVEALRRAAPPTVLLLPVGATEPHGPHAPLATDSLISMSMCTRAARRLVDDPDVRALILPALPYGVTRYAAAFAGAVHVAADTLHALVVDICTSLVDQCLGHIVIVNNHLEPEHVAALRRVVATLRDTRAVDVGYLDLVRRRNAERLTAEFRAGECHAGRYETSLVLADHPELVDRPRLGQLPPVPVNMPAAIAEGRTDFAAMGMHDAYCGAPADATAEEGEATLATLTDMLIEVVRDVALRS